MSYYVYILASARNGTFYVGVTRDLICRTYQHRNKLIPGFTARHNITMLVYYEIHDSIEAAILREKSIKRWTRKKKLAAIEEQNSGWNDLYSGLLG